VTSITIGKSREVQFIKTYEYIHISPSVYFGFRKESGYLIATPEKALLDMVYLCSKGLRAIDFMDLDYTGVNKKLFSAYCNKIQNAQFKGYLKQNIHI
jgi:hypothetical protein